MREARLIQEACRALEARLPVGWRLRLRPPPDPRAGGPDALVDIVGSDGGKTRLVVEAKVSMVPRAVAGLKAQLDSYASADGLVVAPFLTRSTRERLRASGLNYLDLTGNARLILSRPGLYVETEGAAEDPSPAKKPGRSLRGAKAGRIVRALCDFPPPLAISDLAAKAGVAISYASRLVEWLAGEALLERSPRGPVLKIDTGALIRRWADYYQVLTSNDARDYLDPRGLDNLTRRLTEGALPGRYALTGSIAASRLAPVAPPRLAMMYVDDPEVVSSNLGLRPAEAGTNVVLLVPFDDVVFERTWEEAGLQFVAPSQAAVDLLTSPGRAPSEAEAVLDRLTQKAPSRP